MGFMLIRVLFVRTCAGMGFFLQPWGLAREQGLLLGLAFSAGMIATEVRLRRLTSKVLFGGLFGVSVGLVLALGFGTITRPLVIAPETASFLLCREIWIKYFLYYILRYTDAGVQNGYFYKFSSL